MTDNGDNGVGDRYWDNGGRNDFWVRSELVWFIWVPVGYTWKLNTQASIIFGAITAVMKLGALMLTDGKIGFLTKLTKLVGFTISGLDYFLNSVVYDILYAIFIVGTAINIVLSAVSGGIASVIDIVLKVVVVIVGNVLFDWFGKNFLVMGAENLENSNNTVTVTSDLVFQGRSWSRSIE